MAKRKSTAQVERTVEKQVRAKRSGPRPARTKSTELDSRESKWRKTVLD